MRLTRFERKILAAIAAVGIVSLLGALFLATRAFRESYQVGINRRVGGQLEGALDLYQEHFRTLRKSAERTADAIASDGTLRAALAGGNPDVVLEALLARYDDVERIEILSADGSVQSQKSSPDVRNTDELRLLTLTRPLDNALGTSVRVVISTPLARFTAYEQAGEIVDVYTRLEKNTQYVSDVYIGVYIAFLLVVTLIVMVIAMLLSRRVTRRVALVAEATKKVGAGDLSVALPIDSSDEVGELTRAFNEMVRDMRDSRDRIDYLQRISAWQEFARRLAHEIKNPLTPIQLAAQEVHRRYDGKDAVFQKALDDARAIIEEEVATLRRLVGEFSSFAKLPEARLEDADLCEFVTDACRSLATIAEPIEDGGIRVTLTSELPSAPVPVRVDGMMLKRCLDNLVRNAVQAIRDRKQEGGVVSLRARREGARALIEVSDNGPGIPDEDRKRVFDPYFTTKADGTGLGLAIVKKVVLEHGGDISCEPGAGSGATFRIWLPVAK